MPETNNENAFVPGVCNAIMKNGKHCTANSNAGSLRCKFHPLEKYPVSYAEPPASYDPALAVSGDTSRASDRIAAALSAIPLDDPESFRLGLADISDMDIEEDYDESPLDHAAAGPMPTASVPHAEAKLIPQGYHEKYVYDNDADDYVLKVVPVMDTPAYVTDPDTYHDGFQLGQAYHEGEGGAFDYRWIHEDAKMNLTDRKNGFVPVKKALDNQFRVEGGNVTLGDLILARRPKEITAQRAKEVMRSHERLVGEVNEYAHAADGMEHATSFGTVTPTDGFQLDAADPEQVRAARARSRREETPAPRGRKVFAIPSLPWQRDLVAERHGSVGGKLDFHF